MIGKILPQPTVTNWRKGPSEQLKKVNDVPAPITVYNPGNNVATPETKRIFIEFIAISVCLSLIITRIAALFME